MEFSLLLENRQYMNFFYNKHVNKSLGNIFDHEFENSDPHLNFSVDNNYLPLGNYEYNFSLNLLPSVNAMLITKATLA